MDLSNKVVSTVQYKHLRYFFNLVKKVECLISLGVILHKFIPRNIRPFCHFDFVYRGSTSLLFTLDLVSFHVQLFDYTFLEEGVHVYVNK